MVSFRVVILFKGPRGRGFVCVQRLVVEVFNLVRWCIENVVRERDTIS